MLQLPFPDDVTFKYMVYLVGPGLHPEDPELCITSDMCIPISPNTQHPFADREALKSNPPFPYHNCYHWLGPDMWLDLRICNDGRDYSLAPRTQLPAIEHVELGSVGGQDMWRSICARKEILDARCVAKLAELPFADIDLEDEPEASPPPRSTSPVRVISPSAAVSSEQEETAPLVFISEVRHGDEGESERHQHVCEDCGECHSEYGSEYGDGDSYESRSPVYQCSERSYGSEEALEEMNVFGLGGDEGDDLLPIVSISLDIGAHFTSDEDVPDPREFMRQRDELVKYASHCSGDVVHLMAWTGSFKRARLVRKHVRMLSQNSSLLASLPQQRSPSPIALNPARLHHLSDPRKPNIVQPRSMVVRRERPSRKVSISDPLCARLVSTL